MSSLLLRQPWAKLRRRCCKNRSYCRERCDCPILASLSLIGHAADVAAVLLCLLAQPTIRARLARLAGVTELSARDLARLAVLAALHDLGKVNHGFQNQARPVGEKGPRCGHMAPLEAVWLGSKADHGRRTIERWLREAAPDLEAIEAWTGGRHRQVLLAHHGALPGQQSSADPALWQATATYDPLRAVGELVAAIRGWFPEAFATAGQLPWSERFGHAFAGLLMLADWLGSDERRFGYGDGEPDGPERFAWSMARAEAAMLALQLDPAMRREAARRLGWTFAGVFPELAAAGRAARPAQARLLALPPAAGPRLTVLEAETGSGKTEAAFGHFLDLLCQGEVDGLYFALPTRAAAMQIHGRIEALLKACLGEAAPPVGLAVPGYRRMGGEELLPDPAGRWPDDPADALRDRFWAVERPKRYLAGAVMVGTVDQVLLGALKVRHAQLRSAALLRHLLVVDEVHASDVYMTEILTALLDQHLAAGGHALLMSATLGAVARTRLTIRKRQLPPERAAAVAIPYPSLQIGRDEPEGLSEGGLGRPPVAVELWPAWQDLAGPAARIDQAVAQGARVLWLRNTVRDAIAAQQTLEAAGVPTLTCAGQPALHHARFAAEDRLLLDNALEQAFGKARASRPGLVAVTTRTAEMALDVDADLLVTDLCPADVLLQRLGRLHRHDRQRPPGFERAQAIVLAPGEAELAGWLRQDGEVRGAPLGFGRVFPDLLGLLATRRELAELGEVRVPEHCRRLVEAATHPDALSQLADELKGAWQRHRQRIWGTNAAARTVALGNAIEWDKPIQSSGGPDEKITTRLGLDDREAELPEGTTGPFGVAIRRLRVPGWMVGDTPANAQPSAITLAPAGLTFMLGPRRYRYDRLGLRAEVDT